MKKGDFVELVNGRICRITAISGKITCRNIITGQPYTLYKSSVKRVIDADKQWNHEQSHFERN